MFLFVEPGCMVVVVVVLKEEASVVLTVVVEGLSVVVVLAKLGRAAAPVGVAVAPNGVDFVSEPTLVFRHTQQTWAHMLAALAVLLGALLLLRAYSGLRRVLIAKGVLVAAPAHWPEFIQGYVRNQGRYSSVAQEHHEPSFPDEGHGCSTSPRRHLV